MIPQQSDAILDFPAWSYPKLIINAAITGMVPTKAQTPHIPLQPAEIAEDARRCFEAGASILHLHARDVAGNPDFSPSIYADIIGRVRQSCPGAVICASTSGRNFPELEKRAAVLMLDGDLKPDMGSLTLGSLNFPTGPSVNAPETIQGLARIMKERGIVPELEIFDLGMVDYAHYLIGKELLRPPFYFNLILGSLGTANATPMNLAALVQSLPAGATWTTAGIGRFQFFMNAQAIAAGGHVRVGLEDNIWLDAARTRLATNARLIERLVAVAHSLGRRIAEPTDVRSVLGLRR